MSVTPDGGESFETSLRVAAVDGVEPRLGDLVEVLHSGRDAVPMESPPRFRTPAPEPTPAPSDGDPPPSAHDVIGQVLRRLADGSLLSGGPQIVIDDAPPPDADDGSRPTIADLVARASDDPDGVADEILRRVVSGEVSVTQVLDATRAVGPEGTAAARAVLGSLRDRGLLGPAQHAALTRMVG